MNKWDMNVLDVEKTREVLVFPPSEANMMVIKLFIRCHDWNLTSMVIKYSSPDEWRILALLLGLFFFYTYEFPFGFLSAASMHAGDTDVDSSWLCALLLASLRPVDILPPKISSIFSSRTKKMRKPEFLDLGFWNTQ